MSYTRCAQKRCVAGTRLARGVQLISRRPRVIEGIAPLRTKDQERRTEGLRLRPLRGRGAEPIERLREDARDRLGRLVLNLMPLQHVQQLAVAEDRDGR
jgi:hypothetical protein